MAETASNMLALGTVVPGFSLPCPKTGAEISWESVRSDTATVVMFICNHCPYVLHIIDKLVEVSDYYQKKGIGFVAINSNDVIAYPADSPEKMLAFANAHKLPFPYFFDETQAVAKAYHAACTPDFFVFDQDSKCVYRGRFDAATPGNNQPVNGKELSAALDSILKGEPVNTDQRPSLGCNIKWKKA